MLSSKRMVNRLHMEELSGQLSTRGHLPPLNASPMTLRKQTRKKKRRGKRIPHHVIEQGCRVRDEKRNEEVTVSAQGLTELPVDSESEQVPKLDLSSLHSESDVGNTFSSEPEETTHIQLAILTSQI